VTFPIWHPFTQHALRASLPVVERADGAYLYAANGGRFIDAISSWWVTTHGHCHPRITAAIQDQAARLDQIIFAEFTHAAAEKVAQKLLQMTPPELKHVFFSDSGSTSVEVALKMALGYWRHTGDATSQPAREHIVVMQHGYHGDTVGTMSVGERGVFTESYASLLFAVEAIPFPGAGLEQASIDAFESLCRRGGIAALLVEPLVLGAGGMLMYSSGTLRALWELCRKYAVLFIADEVMTGWGRTGSRFACEQAGIAPDIACYSKGLTGGSLPLAVTVCSDEIFAAHFHTDRRRTFFHSSSYTANPMACAAALANLEIWETEPVEQRIAQLVARQARHLEPFRDDPRFDNVRQTGTITAMDLRVADAGYLANVGPLLQQHFRDAHVLLRPLGNTIYVLPPYCTSEQDLDAIYAAIAAIDLVL
jgi:adenosylmethionine-8-amino-7-oxononanoate aminotransferase